MSTITTYSRNELENKSVSELRTIVRDLKNRGQENLQNVKGREIVMLGKQPCIDLITGGSPATDSPAPSPATGSPDKPVDITDVIGGTGNGNGNGKPAPAPATSPAPNFAGGLGALESYFIALIKQHATTEINQEEIARKIEASIKPIVEELKKGITSKIELKRPDSEPILIDTVHKDTSKAIHILNTRDPQNGKRTHLFLSGGAGSGKTKLGSILAKALDVPFYPMSVGGQTTEAKLIGFTSPIDGEYKMTPLGTAIKFGGLALLDEIDAGNSNVLTVLNMLLSNEQVMFGNELITIHENFYCVVAGNTTGFGANRKYVGRNPLDGAFLDRFVFMNWDYDKALEIKLSGNMNWAMRVQDIRRAVDELKMEFVVSPRASITGGMLLAKEDHKGNKVFTQAEVEDLTIFNKIGSEKKAKILNHLKGE